MEALGKMMVHLEGPEMILTRILGSSYQQHDRLRDYILSDPEVLTEMLLNERVLTEILLKDQRVIDEMRDLLYEEFRKCRPEIIKDIFENGMGTIVLKEGDYLRAAIPFCLLSSAVTAQDVSEDDQCETIKILFEQRVGFSRAPYQLKAYTIARLYQEGKNKVLELLKLHRGLRNVVYELSPERKVAQEIEWRRPQELSSLLETLHVSDYEFLFKLLLNPEK